MAHAAQIDLFGRADLRPFWRYYGGKWQAAPTYPPPRHRLIIEPFAGAAGYSVRHAHNDVLLLDISPVIVGIWSWLISASPADILEIPDIPEGGTVDDLDVPQPARWLAGFWCANGLARPYVRHSRYATLTESVKSGQCVPLFDRSVEISWCIDGDDLLVLPFAQSRDLLQEVTEFLGLTEYGWWNNTDRPEGVSGKEWSEREARWKNALSTPDGRMGAPAETMFDMRVADEPGSLCWWPEVRPPHLECNQPFDRRLADVALNIVDASVPAAAAQPMARLVTRVRPGGDLEEVYQRTLLECKAKLLEEPTLEYVTTVPMSPIGA